MLTEEQIEKGRIGEEHFKAWLDAGGFSYLYVSQEPEYFASLFKDTVKRPDFLVLLESIGLLAVDVKHHNIYGTPPVVGLSKEKELERVLMFERLFRMPFWYAFRVEEEGVVI